MSSDEEATIIGRMVLDRNHLIRQGALLSSELSRIGSQLSILGEHLRRINPPYTSDDFRLTDDHYALLDATKIAQLLTEAAEVAKRFQALQQNMHRVGV